jgi:hypothetical protein
MDNLAMRAAIQKIIDDANAAMALIPPDTGVVLKSGDNLQAALDNGGVIRLEDGSSFQGNFFARKAGTRLLGPSASLVGNNGAAALTIPPGAKDVEATIGSATSAWDDCVVQVGSGGSGQTTLADVPRGVKLSVLVPKHRGKRAFYINGADTTLLNCGCRDVWDPAGRDSQGVLILNTPGGIVVDGGTFEAGSENILVGGDATGIRDVVPTDLLFKNVTLFRPESWKTDGVNRKVKNLFELKSGVNVQLLNSTLDGVWTQAQVGWAIMITPRNGKQVANVLLQDVAVKNAGGAVNMLGYDDEAPSPQLVGVTLRRLTANVSSTRGTGRFAQWQAGPKNVLIDACNFDGDQQIVYASQDGTTWVNGVKGTTSITEGVQITNNAFACKSYGIMVNGFAYGKNWAAGFPGGIIENNRLVGPTALLHKGNLPASNVLSAT